MIELKGIPVKFDIDLYRLIGTLLFAEFPITSVFSDSNEEPLIREWADSSDDGEIDRFFYYKTSKYLLKQFIDGKLSHQDFINNALDGFLYFTDSVRDDITHSFVISPIQLPIKYKPDAGFLLREDDVVDYQNIYSYFNLGSEENEKYTLAKLKETSIATKSETLDLHINEGRGIGHGTIEPEILGLTLIHLDNLYENMALDSLRGKNRGYVTEKSKEELSPLYSTEVYSPGIAASYSIFIRPKISNYTIVSMNSFTQIVKKTFDLIESGSDIKTLQIECDNHSNFTINSFKVFLKNIYALQLNIGLNLFNPNDLETISESIDYKKANIIISNIDTLETISQEEFKVKGKFREINLNTGHFIFIGSKEDEFSGYFDKPIREQIDLIIFTKIYEIKVNRKRIKEPERTTDKIEDIITSYYEDV